MASIIPGFEYDIFISYRQKDNKYDGWVTGFVDNLKKELEATFKEEVSVYFDINPHDGLLETHDVDASLKQKLKCLVFIPVISRTYCDPKSFAWENEFKAFVDLASKDQLGLKVTLHNGNVASRILPIRIHELEINDIKLCESIIGGVIRGVDFIYKSTGVNRPLRAHEDHPQDNLNKTYYRDQINKVANAADDIIRSLKEGHTGQKDEPDLSKSQNIIINKRGKVRQLLSKITLGKKQLKPFLVAFWILLCISVGTGVYKIINNNTEERTIAILLLGNSGNDSSLINIGDIFIGSIENKLNSVKSITVRPKISTLPYWGTEKPLNIIRRDLKINYLLSARLKENGNKISISVELSSARKKKMLWSKTYLWDKNQVLGITREIVSEIISELNVRLSAQEEKYIESEPSNNTDANLNYISANLFQKNAWIYYSYGSRILDSISFISAVRKYDKAIEEDPLFALAYAKRAIAISWGFYVGQLDSSYIEKCKKDIDKAMSIENDLAEAQIALGFFYYYCDIDFDKALICFRKAAEMDPGDYEPLFYMAMVYRKMGEWKKSKNLILRVISYNPQEALFLTNIGLSYDYMHVYDSALLYHQKAIDMMPGWSASYKNMIETLILKRGKTAEARNVLESAIKNTGDNMITQRIRLDIYEKKYSDALLLAEKSDPADFKTIGTRYLFLAEIFKALNIDENAKKYYDSALSDLNLKLSQDPNNYQIHGLAGIAYSGLDDKNKAIEEGQKSIALTDKNKLDECDMRVIFAQILTTVGEYDKAITEIAYLLNNPALLSIELLKLDPVWKPLMDNPEYRESIIKYSNN
jgi:tetratricopeptide (TPR) repeat protein